jgi:hypothetical protein
MERQEAGSSSGVSVVAGVGEGRERGEEKDFVSEGGGTFVYRGTC